MSTYINKLIPNTNNVYLRFDPYITATYGMPEKLIVQITEMLAEFDVSFDRAVVEVHDFSVEVTLHIVRGSSRYWRAITFDYSAYEQPELVKKRMELLEQVTIDMVQRINNKEHDA